MNIKKAVATGLTGLAFLVSSYTPVRADDNQYKAETSIVDETVKEAKKAHLRVEHDKLQQIYNNNKTIEEVALTYGADLTDLSKYEQAIKILTRANPSAKSLSLLAIAYAKQGDDKKARECVNRANQVGRDEPYARVAEAEIHLALKQYDEAVPLLEDAVRSDPDNAVFLNYLGFTYTAMQKYEDAIRSLQNAVKVEPDCLVALFNLGAAYGLAGKFDDSKKTFEQLLVSSPNFDGANDALEYVKQQIAHK